MESEREKVEEHLKISIAVASYARVSTLGQTEDSLGRRMEDGSPEAQRKKCEEYIRHLTSKTGISHHLLEHFYDEGFSGSNVKRPAYQRLWQLIATGKVKCIVASELSRLSRSVKDFLELIAHCEKYGVKVHIIGLDLDTSTAFGRVIVVILVALAQFEREMTSTRVRENTITRLLSDGRINGAGEILGLLRDPNRKGHFITDEAGLAMAEKILRLFVKLSSKKKVLAAARDLGLTGPHGKALTMRLIDSTLENAQWRYRGRWCANPENKGQAPELLPPSHRYQIVSLPHGPLLDANLLDAVESKLADTHAKKKRSGKDDYAYLLSHLLFFEDGSRFTGQPGKSREYRYYHNRKHDIRVRCDHLDPFITQRLKAGLSDSKRFEELVEAAIKRRQAALPKVEAELSRVRRELKDLQDAENSLTSQIIDPARRTEITFMGWLEDQVLKLKTRRQQLETECSVLEHQHCDLLKKAGCEDLRETARSFIKEFDKLSGVERRNTLEQFVSKVVITSDNQLMLHVRGQPLSHPVTRWKKSTGSELSGGPTRTRTWDHPVMSRKL